MPLSLRRLHQLSACLYEFLWLSYSDWIQLLHCGFQQYNWWLFKYKENWTQREMNLRSCKRNFFSATFQIQDLNREKFYELQRCFQCLNAEISASLQSHSTSEKHSASKAVCIKSTLHRKHSGAANLRDWIPDSKTVSVRLHCRTNPRRIR